MCLLMRSCYPTHTVSCDFRCEGPMLGISCSAGTGCAPVDFRLRYERLIKLVEAVLLSNLIGLVLGNTAGLVRGARVDQLSFMTHLRSGLRFRPTV